MYDVERLRKAYREIRPDAAPGIDGETWRHYGENLDGNLQDLSGRLKRGAYRAKPGRRAYISKADGRPRPLGVLVLEDKIVQRAVAEVLYAIYEVDFLGFSYGFRPGRSPHRALDALEIAIVTRKVNWVLDADIRGFFDTLDHGWLVKFVEHRVGDQRVVRLIQKWLNAGVLEDGERTQSEVGTIQGGSISPLLANIYLHYVFDLWIRRWRTRQARGEMVVVRFADDFVVGFEHRAEAESFLEELRARFAKFGLELHPDKTRLIEFGRYAVERRDKRGDGKPETFNFLGFTHICAKGTPMRFARKTQRRGGSAPELPLPALRDAESGRPASLRVGLFLHEVPDGNAHAVALKKQRRGGSAPELPLPPSAMLADRHRSGWACFFLRCRGNARAAAQNREASRADSTGTIRPERISQSSARGGAGRCRARIVASTYTAICPRYRAVIAASSSSRSVLKSATTTCPSAS